MTKQRHRAPAPTVKKLTQQLIKQQPYTPITNTKIQLMKKFIALMLVAALSTPAFAALPFHKGRTPHTTVRPVQRAPVSQTILNEDFSKFSEGTETEPAAENRIRLIGLGYSRKMDVNARLDSSRAASRRQLRGSLSVDNIIRRYARRIHLNAAYAAWRHSDHHTESQAAGHRRD